MTRISRCRFCNHPLPAHAPSCKLYREAKIEPNDTPKALLPCPSEPGFDVDIDWREALSSAEESLRGGYLDGWELDLVRRRVENALAARTPDPRLAELEGEVARKDAALKAVQDCRMEAGEGRFVNLKRLREAMLLVDAALKDTGQ